MPQTSPISWILITLTLNILILLILTNLPILTFLPNDSPTLNNVNVSINW